MLYQLLSATGGAEPLTLLETFRLNPLFNVGLLIILGIIGGKLISMINFPKVTGYIIMGIVIGPGVLNIIDIDMVEHFSIISSVAIGFIGYTIGLEIRFKKLKETGKQVSIITLAQAFTTAILVALAIIAYITATGGQYALTYGLILGAIATATAPGPIVAVVKNYRTKGPVTDTLLPLVALDDAIGIMVFAVMLSVGTSLLSGGGLNFGSMVLEPLREIGFSFIFGGIIGLILVFVLKKLNREDNSMLMMMIIGAVLIGIGLGEVIHASAILLPMTIGVVVSNSLDEKYEHRLTQQTDLWGSPILLSFFTIAGLELRLDLLTTAGVVGIIYIIVRVIGKVAGTYFSAKAVKAPPTVTKYLGFTLIPQAGVAINMAKTTKLKFVELSEIGITGMSTLEIVAIGETIMVIALAATVIYEVFGLIVVKTALGKAGEIDAQDIGWDSSH